MVGYRMVDCQNDWLSEWLLIRMVDYRNGLLSEWIYQNG